MSKPGKCRSWPRRVIIDNQLNVHVLPSLFSTTCTVHLARSFRFLFIRHSHATKQNRKKKHSTNFRPNSVPSGNMRIWMSAKVRNSGTREVSLDLGCIASFRRNSGGEWNEEEEGEKKKNKKKTNHPKAHCSFLSPLLHGKFDIAVVEPNFKKRSCAWTCSVVPATFASPLVFQNVKQWRSCPGRRLTLRCASCHDTRPLNRNGISTSPRALFIVAKKKKTNTYGIFA